MSVFALQPKHHNIGPKPTEGHDKEHCGNHVSGWELLELDHAKACCQHDETATGLEVSNHVWRSKRKDKAGKVKERGKKR